MDGAWVAIKNNTFGWTVPGSLSQTTRLGGPWRKISHLLNEMYINAHQRHYCGQNRAATTSRQLS